MEKSIGLVEFLESAHKAGLLPHDTENEVYQSDDYSLENRKKCFEMLAYNFGEVTYESLLDICIYGLGFDFDNDNDLKFFLHGVEQGRQLERFKSKVEQ